MIKGILALLALIPKINELWDKLAAEYIKLRLEKLRDEDREAIRQALDNHDQRKIEWQMGNTKAGDPSFVTGSHVVPDIKKR